MFGKTGKLFTAFLSLMIAASVAIAPVHAIDSRAVIDEPVIEPQWINATTANITLEFSGSKASISLIIMGYSGAKYSNGTVTLIKLTGSDAGTVEEWTGLSSSSPVFSFHDSSQTVTSGTYRATFSVTSTRNGVVETIKGGDTATY